MMSYRIIEDNLAKTTTEFLGITPVFRIITTPLPLTNLSKQETQQYSALPLTSYRNTWLKGRAGLKALLTYFGEDLETTHIKFPNIRFSISHCKDFTIVCGLESPSITGIGVDVEQDYPYEQAKTQFLCPVEAEWLSGLSEIEKLEQMQRIWVLKEAAFKTDPENHDRRLSDYCVDSLSKHLVSISCLKNPALRITCFNLRISETSFAVAISR